MSKLNSMKKYNYVATNKAGKPVATEFDITANDICHALQKIAAALPEETAAVTITESQ